MKLTLAALGRSQILCLLAGFIHSRHVSISVELLTVWELASLPPQVRWGEGEMKDE